MPVNQFALLGNYFGPGDVASSVLKTFVMTEHIHFPFIFSTAKWLSKRAILTANATIDLHKFNQQCIHSRKRSAYYCRCLKIDGKNA